MMNGTMEHMDVDWPSGAAEFVVTTDAVERYVSACGGSWSGDNETVPMTFASVYCYAAVGAMPVRSGVVLTGQSYEFHRRLHIGDRIVTDFHVSEQFERKGRRYMVIRTSTRDDTGDLVCLGRITRMLPDPAVEVA